MFHRVCMPSFNQIQPRNNVFILSFFNTIKGLNLKKSFLIESLHHETKLPTKFHTHIFIDSGSAMMNQPVSQSAKTCFLYTYKYIYRYIDYNVYYSKHINIHRVQPIRNTS